MTMKKLTFKPGDTVYNLTGQVASYVGAYPDHGYVVIPEFEYDDGEPHYGEPVCWMEVFAKPPREKLAGELSELHDSIKAAHEKLRALNDEVAQAQRTRQALATEAAKNPDLAPLAMWLEGRAKFATILGGSYGSFYTSQTVTGPVSEVFKSEGQERGRIRLVALFYDHEAERNHNVRVMRYSDGSGNDSGSLVFFGETADESLSNAAAHMAAQQNARWNDHYYPNIGMWLEHFGFAHLITEKVRGLMVEYQKKADENLAKHARERIERAEREAASARADLEKLGAPA